MAKNLIILGLAAAVIALGWLYLSPKGVSSDSLTATTTPTKDDGVICAQVITGARDPKTGTIKEYSTPCDVPNGWEVIQNDVPSLDLQVQ